FNGQTNTTGIFNNVSAGVGKMYNINDANNCGPITGTIDVAEPSVLSITSADVTSPILCYGGTATVTIIATGGTAPYRYTLNGSTSLTGIFTGLTAGNYTVLVTDANECTDNENIVITQPSQLTSSVTAQSNVSCFGEATGSVTVSGQGGTPQYTYTLNETSNTTGTFTGLVEGTYAVVVSDANGCAVTQDIIITQPASALTATISNQTNISCFGETNGSVIVNAQGGTPGYTYTLNDVTNNTGSFTGLPAGNYIVVVTDNQGCTFNQNVSVSQPVEAIAIATVITNVSCVNGNNGTVKLNVTGGTAPYRYKWSGGQETKDLEGLVAGSYTVTVTDSKGCVQSATVNITAPEAITISYTQSNVSCFGGNDGSITLEVNGGVSPYTYSWSNGQETKDLNNLAANSCTVTVTDANGCSKNATIIITQPASALTATLVVRNTVCRNSNDGSISATVSGGTQPYTYSWRNTTLTSVNISNLTPGSYELTVTDANGCTFTVSGEVLATVCPPVAIDDRYRIDQETVLNGNVSLNDYDGQGETLTFTIKTPVKNGTVVFNANGTFVYTPNPGYYGTETFTYDACNVSGMCTTATVHIDVIPFTIVNLTPAISNVREGRKGSVTATLIRPFKDDVYITLAYSGKATKEKDYVLLDQFVRIKIPKGSLTTTEKLTVAALTDDQQEGDEDVIIRIVSTTDTLVRIGTGAVVIINDIYPPDRLPETPVKNIPENIDITPDPLVSPNGDGQGNEFFSIQNIVSFPDNEVVIFNRWGNEVFRIKGYNESDRVFKGYANTGMLTDTSNPLPDGVYYFLITTNRITNGQTVMRLNKGYLILKR
ncbi:MAG TPA: gliding motility-associated C-terminal domain-containing protein, partial [Sphingobacteriaceae bacterium]